VLLRKRLGMSEAERVEEVIVVGLQLVERMIDAAWFQPAPVISSPSCRACRPLRIEGGVHQDPDCFGFVQG
jgi:hypothetical protein